MTVQGQLLAMLETVAKALGDDLCRQMVFVGGCSTAVLITDEISLNEVRATDDVDLIIDLTGMGAWMQLQEQLQQKGFTVSGEDDVICTMRLGDLKVDFMPDDPDILGFSNRWYKRGIETSVKYVLPSGPRIKHLTAPLFIATKLEAYLGRGKDDPIGSHDLEDILIVIDGRQELLNEIQTSDDDVRLYISQQLATLMRHQDFDNFLYGNVRGPDGRAEIVLERIKAMVT